MIGTVNQSFRFQPKHLAGVYDAKRTLMRVPRALPAE